MPVSMSNDWNTTNRDQTPGSREFETVAAELWLSNKSGAFSGTRKLQTQQRRKNNEKRDSVVQLAPLAEGSPKRLKEKSSWLSMPRGYSTSSAAGQWVRVKCTLIEGTEGENTCILNIVGEKGTLQHSLHINRLRTTDIRFADRSLFFRDDCLGIHGRPGVFAAHSPSHQTLVSMAISDQISQRHTHHRQQSGALVFEPIYLAFEGKDAVNCWNALLRSYAQPEIYGRNVEQRGLYRMWRQVNLTLVSGRGLGTSGRHVTAEGLASTSLDTERGDGPAADATSDLEVFCEVLLDGLVSGRSTSQKGQAAAGVEVPIWTWHETFTLSDLPPFGFLSIRVWREKKSSKPTLVGTVEIGLANFRRGKFVEGWSPVVFTGPGRNDVQVGDLRLKIKVDEEIILPLEDYAGISSVLDERNSLDLLRALDQKMQLSDVSPHVLSLAVGRGTFMKDILTLAEREVGNAPNANTLFRGNTVFTKTVEQAMLFFGRPFLEASVGSCIQDLCLDRVEIETDPSRKPNRPKEVEASVKLLPIWCTRFWTQIYKARGQCPSELRRLFQCIRELVEKRFGPQAAELRWQSVSAFCFLRLIVPAILHPHLFGLHPGLPPPPQQRSLTLIAKSLQSLANLSKEQKESYMSAVSGFLGENIPAMIDYIIQISSLPPPERGHVDVSDKYDRLHIMQSLRERARTLPPLTSEAIPMLPHLLDIPKHFAIVSSAVIRHARNSPHSLASSASLVQDSLVEDFAVRCFEIEAKAVQCVSRLAGPSTSVNSASRNSRRVSNRRRSNSPSQGGRSTEGIKRTSTSVADGHRLGGPSGPHRKSARPSTAPAAPSSNSSSTFNTPIPSPTINSPITFAPHRKPSNDGGNTPPTSPNASFFRRRPPTSPGERVTSAATTSNPLPHPLYRTQSQQLPVSLAFDEEAAAKRRGFLRGFLARSTK